MGSYRDIEPTTASSSDLVLSDVADMSAARANDPAPAPHPKPQAKAAGSGSKGPRRCDTCGNVYDKAFDLVTAERSWVFDSLECAAQAIAPRCGHCSCRVLGHGVETRGVVYCCANCASEAGAKGFRDRV